MKEMILQALADGFLYTYAISVLIGAAVFLGLLSLMDWISYLIREWRP